MGKAPAKKKTAAATAKQNTKQNNVVVLKEAAPVVVAVKPSQPKPKRHEDKEGLLTELKETCDLLDEDIQAAFEKIKVLIWLY